MCLQNHGNVSITLSDFITTFRDFSQSLAKTQELSEQDTIDPIGLSESVLKLIDENIPQHLLLINLMYW